MKRRLSPGVILLIGWLVFMLFAYPGYLNSEAVDELIDSRYGSFTDWHSPMLTEVWRLVGVLVSGPAGMLVLQSTMLLVATYRLLERVITGRRAAVAAVGIMLFPPVIGTLGLICPETQMTAFLGFGLVAIASPRRAVKITGLVAIVIATGMRPGGALAALPIVVLGFVWSDGHRRLVRYALATATWAVIVAGAAGVNALVVDMKTDRPAVWLAGFDIAGTVAKAGPIDDAQLRAELTGVTIVADRDLQQRTRELYDNSTSLMDGPQRLFDAPTTEDATDRVEAARWSLALAHPSAYAAHRWRQVVRVLGLSRGKAWSPLYTNFVGHPSQRAAIRHTATHARVQKLLMAIVRAFSTGVLVRPYVYFALALILIPLAIKRRQRAAVILLASGIVFELALFVVTDAAEYRYSYWMIVATLIAIVMMIGRGVTRVQPTPAA